MMFLFALFILFVMTRNLIKSIGPKTSRRSRGYYISLQSILQEVTGNTRDVLYFVRKLVGTPVSRPNLVFDEKESEMGTFWNIEMNCEYSTASLGMFLRHHWHIQLVLPLSSESKDSYNTNQWPVGQLFCAVVIMIIYGFPIGIVLLQFYGIAFTECGCLQFTLFAL